MRCGTHTRSRRQKSRRTYGGNGSPAPRRQDAPQRQGRYPRDISPPIAAEALRVTFHVGRDTPQPAAHTVIHQMPNELSWRVCIVD